MRARATAFAHDLSRTFPCVAPECVAPDAARGTESVYARVASFGSYSSPTASTLGVCNLVSPSPAPSDFWKLLGQLNSEIHTVPEVTHIVFQ